MHKKPTKVGAQKMGHAHWPQRRGMASKKRSGWRCTPHASPPNVSTNVSTTHANPSRLHWGHTTSIRAQGLLWWWWWHELGHWPRTRSSGATIAPHGQLGHGAVICPVGRTSHVWLGTSCMPYPERAMQAIGLHTITNRCHSSIFLKQTTYRWVFMHGMHMYTADPL